MAIPPSGYMLRIFSLILLLAVCSCKSKPSDGVIADNAVDGKDTLSISYTVALPDAEGEGMRITYTFSNMKVADTGSFRMTHVYMRHTGTDDTTIVNGTWKQITTDSGDYINVYSGRSIKRFSYSGNWTLQTLNTDSLVADTGWIQYRRKKDNDLRNSSVLLFGKVRLYGENNATFVEPSGDTIPILKISAFADLVSLNDTVDLDSESVIGVELTGTIQIRMAMDGKSHQKALIVEEVGEVVWERR